MCLLDVIIVVVFSALCGALHSVLVHGGYINKFYNWLFKEDKK